MGRQKKLRDKRTRRHVTVFDAAQVIAFTRQLASEADDPTTTPVRRRSGAVAQLTLKLWDRSPVILQVDMEFARALLDSDTDVELPTDWLDRLPFETVAFSFETPISLHDGDVLCHYTGCVAVGTKHRTSTINTQRREIFTTYHPFAGSEGVRFLWTYVEDGSPAVCGQSITFNMRGEFHSRNPNPPRTLREFIADRQALAIEQGYGEELATLVPLSAQLLLYLVAQDPDLDWPAPETISRPQQLMHARVGQLGWRVGSAVRRWRQESGVRRGEPGASGWRLPPHIRKAHWTRVRVAERDEQGIIIGDRLGTIHVDWHYEPRWIPPTPVNAGPGGKVAPAVRALAQESE